MGFRTMIFLASYFFHIVIISSEEVRNQTELKFLITVFRHGDRTPATNEMYPNDPHATNSFYPEGPGQLTNQGKRRAYQLGQSLRNRYNDYLGDIYTPECLVARSTEYDRTKMSLQLLLASLYPPKDVQIWNKKINWQPIPAIYVPKTEDKVFDPRSCPEFLREREAAEKTIELSERIEGFRTFMNELTEITGKNITKPDDMYRLYHTLTAEKFMNLTLPKWTWGIFPDGKLFDATVLTYDIYSYNKIIKRLNGGQLLREIIQKLRTVESGMIEEGRKLLLYSAHEDNIAALLATLGIYKPHVPEYSSAIIFELHGKDQDYHVKIDYYKGIQQIYEPQKIPGCDKLCPFHKFVDLLKDVTPSDDEKICAEEKRIEIPNEINLKM